MAVLAHFFLRLRRAKRGFALGTVPDSPESATLAVTIIPVTLEGGVVTPGRSALARRGPTGSGRAVLAVAGLLAGRSRGGVSS